MSDDQDDRSLLRNVDPHNPDVQIRLLAQRVDALTREKEALEVVARATQDRLLILETTKGMGLDTQTMEWLKKADEKKLSKIDSAIDFMDGAEFMGKWTWRFVAGFIALSASFYTAFKFWKGGP